MKNTDSRYPKKRGILKRFLPQTLFFRSLLILIVPIILIQIIVTTVFFDRHWSKVTSRLAFAVSGEIALLIEELPKKDLSGGFEHNLDLLVTFEEGEKLSLMDLQKESRAFGWAAMIRNTLDKELTYKVKQPYLINVDFKEKWIGVRIQMETGILNIDIPQRRLFSSSTYIFLLWMFAASTVLLIIAVFFMRNQTRPIRRLAIAAERFGKGREVHNFKTEGAREVRQAGEAFIKMKERIKRQISQRTEMLAGVSHDLRTPLTRLKLQISMMGDSSDIHEMKKDISDMEKMIDGYLNFVRGDGQEKSVRVVLDEMLHDIAIAARREGCAVDLDLNNMNYSLMLRALDFKRAITNIVSNAVKHADHIWITLEKEEQHEIKIIIEDNGPGIEQEKFEEVFRPFYRIDSSRNQETGGVGLGLSIARDIVHAHGGELELQKSPHGGLAVHIILPV